MKKLKALIIAANEGGSDAFELRYRAKSREVQRSVCRDKREFAIALVREAEDAADRNDFRTVYRITKELACGRKSFDGPVKDVNGRLLIHDDEQLKRWKEHFTTVLNRITSGEVPPLVDEMASHRNMRIRTVPPSRREIISAINALKRSKAAGLDGLPAELFIAAPAVTADLLLPLVRKSWESETFPREWKKGMIVKIPKKGTRFECDNWRGICVLPTVAKVIAKIILERIKEHLESLIDREQAGFRTGSSCIDPINTSRIILEQCAEFRFALALHQFR